MRRTILFLAFAILFAFSSSCRAALVPPYFVSAVVSLGSAQAIGEPGKAPSLKWVTEGAGFFYGYLVHDDADVSKKRYAVFLVTAAHVVKNHPGIAGALSVRVDATEVAANSKNIAIPPGEWFFHSNPEVDLAAVAIPMQFLETLKLESAFFASDVHAVKKSEMPEIGVAAGDGIFTIGFPMGLAGEQRNYAMVRQGAIARIAEYLDGASRTFYIDSFVFPGNSGGPVILKPEITSIAGTKSNSKASLLGVVIAYQPYVDSAVSPQTKRTRITFEENSGLAIVIPVDFVNELVQSRAATIWQNEEKANATGSLSTSSPKNETDKPSSN